MRVVSRRHTRPKVVVPQTYSAGYPNEETGIDTLVQRFKGVKPGESLYPWANTELVIVSGKRRWIAKASRSE